MQLTRDDRGLALIGVVILSALLMALAVALAVAVRSDTQLRGAFASGVTGFYAAESGLNKGMGEYRPASPDAWTAEPANARVRMRRFLPASCSPD